MQLMRRSSVHTDHTEEGGSRKKQAERKGGRRDTLAGEMSCSDYVFLTNMAPARSLTNKREKDGKKGGPMARAERMGVGAEAGHAHKMAAVGVAHKAPSKARKAKKNHNSQLLPGSFRVAATDAVFGCALFCASLSSSDIGKASPPAIGSRRRGQDARWAR